MQIHQHAAPAAVSLPTLSSAVADLKARLQQDYEQAYPELQEIIHIVLDQEEARAWELSFPHLFLPDLVEEHITRLNLQPAGTRRANLVIPRASSKVDVAIAHAAARCQSLLGAMRRQIDPEEGNNNLAPITTQLEPVAQH
jgi:hypothetical protein